MWMQGDTVCYWSSMEEEVFRPSKPPMTYKVLSAATAANCFRGVGSVVIFSQWPWSREVHWCLAKCWKIGASWLLRQKVMISDGSTLDTAFVLHCWILKVLKPLTRGNNGMEALKAVQWNSTIVAWELNMDGAARSVSGTKNSPNHSKS